MKKTIFFFLSLICQLAGAVNPSTVDGLKASETISEPVSIYSFYHLDSEYCSMSLTVSEHNEEKLVFSYDEVVSHNGASGEYEGTAYAVGDAKYLAAVVDDDDTVRWMLLSFTDGEVKITSQGFAGYYGGNTTTFSGTLFVYASAKTYSDEEDEQDYLPSTPRSIYDEDEVKYGCHAFIRDKDGPFTNIRNKPSGDVVAKIPTDMLFSFQIVESSGKWLRIDKNTLEDYEDYGDVFADVKGDCWIHSSVVLTSTKGDGGVLFELRDKPGYAGKVIYSSEESSYFWISEIDHEWVKVRTTEGNHEGWINGMELCGSPVTVCDPIS